MVGALWARLATSLEHILCKPGIIKLWVMQDHGTSYMQKFTLSSGQDMTILKELLSTSPVMIDAADLQKLHRAGLVPWLFEKQESNESYTPQQRESNTMTYTEVDVAYMKLHNAEDLCEEEEDELF